MLRQVDPPCSNVPILASHSQLGLLLNLLRVISSYCHPLARPCVLGGELPGPHRRGGRGKPRVHASRPQGARVQCAQVSLRVAAWLSWCRSPIWRLPVVSWAAAAPKQTRHCRCAVMCTARFTNSAAFFFDCSGAAPQIAGRLKAEARGGVGADDEEALASRGAAAAVARAVRAARSARPRGEGEVGGGGGGNGSCGGGGGASLSRKQKKKLKEKQKKLGKQGLTSGLVPPDRHGAGDEEVGGGAGNGMDGGADAVAGDGVGEASAALAATSLRTPDSAAAVQATAPEHPPPPLSAASLERAGAAAAAAAGNDEGGGAAAAWASKAVSAAAPMASRADVDALDPGGRDDGLDQEGKAMVTGARWGLGGHVELLEVQSIALFSST